MIEPAKTIAAYNPLSFIVEGIREPMISGIDATETLDAVLAILGIVVLGLALSARALRHRLRVGLMEAASATATAPRAAAAAGLARQPGDDRRR